MLHRICRFKLCHQGGKHSFEVFLNEPTPASVWLFSFFSNTIFTKKISRILTRIVRVEGEHADPLTTTTAKAFNWSWNRNWNCFLCIYYKHQIVWNLRPRSSLVHRDEQPDWPNIKACIECCHICVALYYWFLINTAPYRLGLYNLHLY